MATTKEQGAATGSVRFAAPTMEFDAFVHDFTVAQRSAKVPVHRDAFERQLWGAAEFDWHRQTGEVTKLTDARGKPHGYAGSYARMIEIAVNALAAGN